jgi:hypothetical protein
MLSRRKEFVLNIGLERTLISHLPVLFELHLFEFSLTFCLFDLHHLFSAEACVVFLIEFPELVLG